MLTTSTSLKLNKPHLCITIGQCVCMLILKIRHKHHTFIQFTLDFSFLPCDALRCTVFVIVILSIRPSVCLSVTLVDCVHMVQPTIMISSPYGSPIILVSGDITFIPKFEGGHPERGR